MSEIDFVPDEYVQTQESNRANFLYLGLLLLMFTAFFSTYGFLKIRLKSLEAEDAAVDKKLTRAQESIAKLEQLQKQKQDMLKTALLTAELIEPIPRSVTLAMLTNSVPQGLSLTDVKLFQKKLNSADIKLYKSKYEKMKSNASKGSGKSQDSDHINMLEIQGLAGDDIPVADYISTLTDSILLEDVSLVKSSEFETENGIYRQFELSAVIKEDITLSNAHIDRIAQKNNYKPINGLREIK